MSRCVTSVILAALLGSASAAAAPHELYDNVVPADTADCLEKASKSAWGPLGSTRSDSAAVHKPANSLDTAGHGKQVMQYLFYSRVH